MRALLEVTDWGNHHYNHAYWVDGDKIYAYSRDGICPPEYFKTPMTLYRRGRKFKEITNHAFEEISTEQKSSVIKVAGSKGAVYEVDLEEKTCTCKGFQFRGSCRHLTEADNKTN